MKKKRSHVGCLFWVALILLLVVVFLFNRPKIAQVLKSTGLTNLVTKQTTQPEGPSVTRVPNNDIQTRPEVTLAPSAGKKQSTKDNSSKQQNVQPKSSPIPQPKTQTTAPKLTVTPAPPSRPKQPATKTIAKDFQVFFVKVDTNGKPIVAPIEKKIEYIDSPLTKTFDTLLEGVGEAEGRKGFRSLIPEGTKLLSATVKNGTAYLDFNDRFRFNSYGVEGYNAQLEQVVFTATQFQTVKRVQILLDGKVRNFLAPEGIAIDEPLDRKTFQG